MAGSATALDRLLAQTDDAPLDPLSVSPGVLGFTATFVLALVLWLLLRNMTGRLRGVKRRGLEAEAAERARAGRGDDGAERDNVPIGPDS